VDELTKEFLAESLEGLDRMDRCLTELEHRPADKELLGEIFRSVHTIKGTTGFLGFTRLEKLAHAGETLLGSLRDGRLTANAPLVSGLLRLMDGLRAILQLIELTGGEGSRAYDDAAATAIIARFDPASKAPVVVFASYTGGAHCCYVFIIAKLQGPYWRTWRTNCDCDLQHGMVRVLARGQPPVLILPDHGFDGAFAAHSGSVSPPRIYQFRRGELFDVSSDPAFRTLYRRSMSVALSACRRAREPNGGCAALVAEASRAGQTQFAWKETLAHYNRSSQTYPSGCRVKSAAEECEGGAWKVFENFPDSLRWFLWRHGYAPAAAPFPCESDFCPVPWPDSAPPPDQADGRSHSNQ